MKTILTMAVLMLSFSACAPLKPLSVNSLNDFKVDHLTSSPQLSANLNLHNPNKVGATVKSFSVNLALSELPVAAIQLSGLRMPANHDFTVPLATTASYDQLIKLLPSAIASFSGGKDIPLHLTGSVTLKKFIFKKTFPFELKSTINTRQISMK